MPFTEIITPITLTSQCFQACLYHNQSKMSFTAALLTQLLCHLLSQHVPVCWTRLINLTKYQNGQYLR